MSRFLVTGGCGFIGSHLVAALAAAGHHIRILDNLSTGKREHAPAGAELVVGDICHYGTMADCLEDVDGVFHLAAIASVVRSREDWLGCHAINLTGFINLLVAAQRRTTAPRVVYASSAAIYGDNPTLPLSEAETPRPITAYGADKLGCELHALVATLTHGVPTLGLRLFNVYGPRQDPHSPYSGVISIFADRLRGRQPIDVYDDGAQSRDFVSVLDVVEFFIAAMEAKSCAGEVFNVCTGTPTTIIELANTLGDIFGTAPQIRFKPARTGDIRNSLGDPSAARRALGCTSLLTLRQGLELMLRTGRVAAATSV